MDVVRSASALQLVSLYKQDFYTTYNYVLTFNGHDWNTNI
jgi:hypothetical protein